MSVDYPDPKNQRGQLSSPLGRQGVTLLGGTELRLDEESEQLTDHHIGHRLRLELDVGKGHVQPVDQVPCQRGDQLGADSGCVGIAADRLDEKRRRRPAPPRVRPPTSGRRTRPGDRGWEIDRRGGDLGEPQLVATLLDDRAQMSAFGREVVVERGDVQTAGPASCRMLVWPHLLGHQLERDVDDALSLRR